MFCKLCIFHVLVKTDPNEVETIYPSLTCRRKLFKEELDPGLPLPHSVFLVSHFSVVGALPTLSLCGPVATVDMMGYRH